jgi:hypothetical protein
VPSARNTAVSPAFAARPLRVAMVWNGALYAEHLLSEPTEVTLGSERGALFPLPEGFNAADKLTLLAPRAEGYELQPVPGMRGSVWRNGQREAVERIGAPVALDSSDYGVVTFGPTAVFFQHVRPVQGPPPRRTVLDGALPASLGLSLFLHAVVLLFVFVIAAREYAPPEPLELDSELLRKFLINPPPEDLPNKKLARAEQADRGLRDREEASGERARDKEGKAGKRESTADKTQITGKPADAVAQQVRGLGLLGVLSGGRNRAVTTALDTPSVQGLLGGLGSAQDVIGHGSSGLSTRGGGVGGGGRNQGVLFGAGDLGTAVAGGKGSGFLSPEQINRVVQANRAAIKYCFEGGLQRDPKLQGSVSAAFRIDRKGAVASTRVAKSTLGDGKVEGCILRQIQRWKFPEPDGGEVDVVYPFLFRGQ